MTSDNQRNYLPKLFEKKQQFLKLKYKFCKGSKKYLLLF